MENTPEGPPTPRQSFRVVGGVSSAQIEVLPSEPRGVKAVAVTGLRPERFLVVPVQDVPSQGSSIKEDGYKEATARARVMLLFGPTSHLSDEVWAQALPVITYGGKIIFALGTIPIQVGDEQKFLIEILR